MTDAAETDTAPPTRWEQQVVGDRWTFYADRFDKMISDGTDLEGEARFVDAMLQRGSDVLDAGCGTGRVAAALKRMGHNAIGVDKDAGLIGIARGRYDGVPYLNCDLYLLDAQKLVTAGGPPAFDVIALPGNVVVYLAEGSERQVLGVLAGLLKPAGRIVAGFATDREYSPEFFKNDAEALGLTVEYEYATWQMDPVAPSSSWTVIVLRGPGESGGSVAENSWAPPTSWPSSAG